MYFFLNKLAFNKEQLFSVSKDCVVGSGTPEVSSGSGALFPCDVLVVL